MAVQPPMKFRNDEDDDERYEMWNRSKKPKNCFTKTLHIIQKLFKCCCFDVCPPCPCCVIQNFAFQNKKTTYSLELKPGSEDVYGINFKRNCDAMVKYKGKIQNWVNNINWYFIKPAHTKRLACCYIKTPGAPSPLFVILFCHATAVDLNHQLVDNYYLSWRLCCDVFAFDYSGYGASSGRPSEYNIYRDVVAAYGFLTETLKVAPKKIVVFGQSLGTVAAVRLASEGVPLAGLVLEGVILSAFRILCPARKEKISYDIFDCLDRIGSITCPTLVLQGALDDVTNLESFDHFMELCNTLVPPLVIPNGNHCSMQHYRAYWNRLEIFIGKELGSGTMPYRHNCHIGCLLSHGKRRLANVHHRGLEYPFKSSDHFTKYVFDRSKLAASQNTSSGKSSPAGSSVDKNKDLAG